MFILKKQIGIIIIRHHCYNFECKKSYNEYSKQDIDNYKNGLGTLVDHLKDVKETIADGCDVLGYHLMGAIGY